MLFRELSILNFVDKAPRRQTTVSSYEGRKAGIEKRFSEILGAVRAHLEQLRAYLVKSNLEYERRLKEQQKGSLTRQSLSEKAMLMKRMEEENARKI